MLQFGVHAEHLIKLILKLRNIIEYVGVVTGQLRDELGLPLHFRLEFTVLDVLSFVQANNLLHEALFVMSEMIHQLSVLMKLSLKVFLLGILGSLGDDSMPTDNKTLNRCLYVG